MSYKVVRDNGRVVAFGPNEDWYEPGSAYTVEDEAPTLVPIPPTPAEQIRALEAQYADAQAKLTRQSLLALALDKACADPLAENLAREDVHAFLLAGDNGYAALWNLEQQVEALRAQV